jgi:hypothetical protein
MSISDIGHGKARAARRRRLTIFALEPRVMYDGAAAATAAHHADHHHDHADGHAAGGPEGADHAPPPKPAPAITAAVGQPVNGGTVELQGTGKAGDTINLYADGSTTMVGTGKVGPGGTFDMTTTATFADGVHSIVATETDAANRTRTSTAFAVNVDPNAPVITAVVGQPAKGGTVELKGTGQAGETINLYADSGTTIVGTGTVGSDGSFDITTTTKFADGVHKFAATETDGAGLTSALSTLAFPVNVDPNAQVVVAADPALDGGKLEIAFVDGTLADYQTLIGDIRPGVEVVVISGPDGLQQIAAFLKGQTGVDAIHIISHGGDGVVDFGGENLTTGDISSYQATLAAIGSSLVPGGDILIYGCDVAAGSAGETLIQQIASYTHDHVAAATGLVGAASLGGNWDLDFQVGTIDVATAINAASGANYNFVLKTYAFTDGTGSATNSGHPTVTTTYQDLTLTETDNSSGFKSPTINYDATFGVQAFGGSASATARLDITKTDNSAFAAA